MAADLEAEAGSDTALPLIEQLRAYQPAEADTILATLRLRQSRLRRSGNRAGRGVRATTASIPWPLAAAPSKPR